MDYSKQPLASVSVIKGYFRDFLPNGSYVEWLESLGAPVRALAIGVCIRVTTFQINSLDEIWCFHLRGDDCTLATYEFNTRTQKLVCTCPFIDDDEAFDVDLTQYNNRLKEFCNKYRLTPKFV